MLNVLAITCGNPSIDNNAFVSAWTPVMNYTGYNASIIYQCEVGYWYNPVVYQSVITCNASGSWAPEYQHCAGGIF